MNDLESLGSGMPLRTQILVATIGLAMLLFVLNMVRRKQMREQYSLVWLLGTFVIILCSAFVDQVDRLAHFVGIQYPPAFLFLVAILVVLALQFHFSAVISSLREQNKSLTQDLGILASELRELRDRFEQPGADSERQT